MLSNVKQIQKNTYEMLILQEILNSNFFFVCFLNATQQTQLIELKTFCNTKQITLQIFKNKVFKKVLKDFNWSFLNNILYSQLIVGYSSVTKQRTPQEIAEISTVLLENKSVGFLFGYFFFLVLR